MPRSPDFFCIGAQKAGTTWLQRNLERHPQVWLPPLKEMHFFDHPETGIFRQLLSRKNFLRKGRRLFWRSIASSDWPTARWAARYAFRPRSEHWYRSLWPTNETLTVGEVCPGYAKCSSRQIAALKQVSPDARIIYLLRNPFDQIWSSLAMHWRHKHAGIDAVDVESILRRAGRPKSMGHVQYAENLRRYLQHFPREQILIIFYDELADTPDVVLGRIQAFLNVESVATIDPTERHNTSRGERPTNDVARAIARLVETPTWEIHELLPCDTTLKWLRELEEQPASD